MISVSTPTTNFFNWGYAYGPIGQNNGNPSTITNNLDSNRTQTFTYDSLNRILTAQSQATAGTACWGQGFAYDAWGNLQTISQTRCSPPMLNATADNKNHMIGFNYDAAGNLTKEGSSTPFWNYSWDAENRLSSISGSASDTFTYDGDGERVKRSYGALFWRQHGGPFLSKTNLSGSIVSERIYFNGLHIAIAHPPSGPVNYLFQDHLGGEHIVTDATGNLCQDIDTLPFGSEARFNTACDVSYRFAGMERDDEISANLDYAIGRYYDSRLGRFLSSDDPLIWASKNDPQSWNLYSYVQNNPLNRVDPTGHLTIIVPGTGYDPKQWNQNMKLVNEAKQRFHDSDVRILPWKSGLGGGKLEGGAQDLIKMVHEHPFASGEQLNVIGHSRGGDVPLCAAARLDHKIDNLITLGTPQYAVYPDLSNIGTWTNVSDGDSVQQMDSIVSGGYEYFPGANNVILNAGGYNSVTAHSALWTDDNLRNQWWEAWQNQCHEWWDSRTNTLHGCP